MQVQLGKGSHGEPLKSLPSKGPSKLHHTRSTVISRLPPYVGSGATEPLAWGKPTFLPTSCSHRCFAIATKQLHRTENGAVQTNLRSKESLGALRTICSQFQQTSRKIKELIKKGG